MDEKELLTELKTDVNWIKEQATRAYGENREEHNKISSKLDEVKNCYAQYAEQLVWLKQHTRDNRKIITVLIGFVTTLTVGLILANIH